MEQTLRESDDGILVYVAPTKALVAQISAEIYARFSKELQNGEPRLKTKSSKADNHSKAHAGLFILVIIASTILKSARF